MLSLHISLVRYLTRLRSTTMNGYLDWSRFRRLYPAPSSEEMSTAPSDLGKEEPNGDLGSEKPNGDKLHAGGCRAGLCALDVVRQDCITPGPTADRNSGPMLTRWAGSPLRPKSARSPSIAEVQAVMRSSCSQSLIVSDSRTKTEGVSAGGCGGRPVPDAELAPRRQPARGAVRRRRRGVSGAPVVAARLPPGRRPQGRSSHRLLLSQR